jgi:hypothetical protein
MPGDGEISHMIMEISNMKRLALLAAVAAIFALPVSAAELGIGVGGVSAGAVSGSGSTVSGSTGSGSLSALAGVTAGNDCAAGATNTNVTEFQSLSSSGSGSLGLAGSVAAGQSTGGAIGGSLGQGSAGYNYISIFAQP